MPVETALILLAGLDVVPVLELARQIDGVEDRENRFRLGRTPPPRRPSRSATLDRRDVLVHLAKQMLPDSERPVPLVRSLDDGPRGFPGTGNAQGSFRGLSETVVQLEVVPIQLRDAPTCACARFKGGEASVLSFLTEMEPQLHDQRTVVRKGFLEGGDPDEGGVELGVPGLLVHAADYWIRIPGSEEDADPAAGWKRTPESPEIRSIPLLVGHWSEPVSLEIPRVHPLMQQVDGLSPSRPVDAGHYRDDWKRRAL